MLNLLTITITGQRGGEWQRIAGTATFPTMDAKPRLALRGVGQELV